jgi:hypothetical protein
MTEKNSNLAAKYFVIGETANGRLKFLAGYDNANEAAKAASEFDAKVMTPDYFFSLRPEMRPGVN